MSQFYNRYIPPARKVPEAHAPKDTVDDQFGQDHAASSKKRKRSKPARIESSHERNTTQPRAASKSTPEDDESCSGQDVLDRYSISKFVDEKDGVTDVRFRKSKGKVVGDDPETLPLSDLTMAGSDTTVLNEQRVPSKKHSGLLSKLEKSQRGSRSKDSHVEDVEDREHLASQIPLRGLDPIPQPSSPVSQTSRPTYSTIPAWQSEATQAASSSRTLFSELGIVPDLVENLDTQDIKAAFPIQSTVIPLLLGASDRDLCVSAATGSGKTLAYVLPIIQSLLASNKEGLRAVIVVPTRDLVKQVKATCEMCNEGFDLRIAAAVGSKELEKERALIVEEIETYDPIAYEEEMRKPIDWTTFSLEKCLKRAQERDIVDSIGYVTRVLSKIDVLVTTPGRLVDHLQNTDGFHLDQVEWLVIDEADRLLNESYQEWINTVVPALESRNATKEVDEILTHMRMDLPPRRVKKVLLSATMTQDISKLNSVGLVDPQLIVLQASAADGNVENDFSEQSDTNAEQRYSLPKSLKETAVAIKKDADKPLILLELLEKHIGISTSSTSSDEESTSSSETESSTDDESPRLKSQNNRRVLVFTRSTDSANRLSRLLTILSPVLGSQVATLTRSGSSSASRKALSSFKSGKSTMLITTDRASRGIDVHNLEHVLNYDVPRNAKTYVHRVGRTARAGRSGRAWTIVEHQEGRWFWNEIGGKSADCRVQRDGKVKKIEVNFQNEKKKEEYDRALQALGVEVRGDE